MILVCLEIWFKKKVQKGAAVKDLPSAVQLLLLLRLSVEHTELESIWKIMRASYTNKQAHRYATNTHTITKINLFLASTKPVSLLANCRLVSSTIKLLKSCVSRCNVVLINTWLNVMHLLNSMTSSLPAYLSSC